MTDVANEVDTEVAKTVTGAEHAVGDLLSRLRLAPGAQELHTVLDWLDEHGVLLALSSTGSSTPKTEPDDGATEVPPAAVPAVGAPVAAGEAPGAAAPAAAPSATDPEAKAGLVGALRSAIAFVEKL